MCAAASRFDDERYISWLKGSLSLLYLKQGIQDVANTDAARFHAKLKQAIPRSESKRNVCNRCTPASMIKDSQGRWQISCPFNICNRWLDQILQCHSQQTMADLCLENVTPRFWSTSPWEVCKMYMSSGCHRDKNAKDADVSAILELFQHCTYFGQSGQLERTDLINELLNMRSLLYHSESLQLEEATLTGMVKTMLEFLSGVKSLSATERMVIQQAMDKIIQLHIKQLDLSMNRELELQALHMKQSALEKDIKNLISDQTRPRHVKTSSACHTQPHLANISSAGNDNKQYLNKSDEMETNSVMNVAESSQQVGEADAVEVDVDKVTGKIDGEDIDGDDKGNELGTAAESADLETDYADSAGLKAGCADLADLETDCADSASHQQDDIDMGTDSGDEQQPASEMKLKKLQAMQFSFSQFISTNGLTDDMSTLFSTKPYPGSRPIANKKSKQSLHQPDIATDASPATSIEHPITMPSPKGAPKPQSNMLRPQLYENEAQTGTPPLKTSKLQEKRKLMNPEVAYLQTVLIQHYRTHCLSVPHPASPLESIPLENLYIDQDLKVLREANDSNLGLRNVTMRETPTSLSRLREIFFAGENRSHQIYIQGEAGSGKTMLCKNLVNMWCKVHTEVSTRIDDEEMEIDEVRVGGSLNRRRRAATKNVQEEDREILSDFSLLFYIRLCDALADYDIRDMIEHQLFQLYNGTRLYRAARVLEAERCLVILDGLDEWRRPEGANAGHHQNRQLPGRFQLPQHTVVLTTTRPWAYDVYEVKGVHCDKHIQLRGMNIKSSKSLCSKVLSLLNNTVSCQVEDEDLLATDWLPSILQFHNVPYIMIQLICLWFDHKQLGNSQMQIYCRMLEMLLSRAEKSLPSSQEISQTVASSSSSLTGALPTSSGSQNNQTGTQSSQTGNQAQFFENQTGSQKSESDSQSTKTGSQNGESGSQSTQTGSQNSETGSQNSQTGSQANESTVTSPEEALPACFTKLLHSPLHKEILLSLSKVAFRGMFDKDKAERFVFGWAKIGLYNVDQPIINLCIKSGLFSQLKMFEKYSCREKRFAFLHKKLQEFLAALYIATSEVPIADDLVVDPIVLAEYKRKYYERDIPKPNILRMVEFCTSTESVLEKTNVWMFLAGIRPEFTSNILEILYSKVISRDENLKTLRLTASGRHIPDLPIHVQRCMLNILREAEGNGHQDLCISLEDVVIATETFCSLKEKLVETNMDKIKSVYITLPLATANTNQMLESSRSPFYWPNVGPTSKRRSNVALTLDQRLVYFDCYIDKMLTRLQGVTTLQKLYINASGSPIPSLPAVALIIESKLNQLTCLELLQLELTQQLTDAIAVRFPHLTALTLWYVTMTHDQKIQMLSMSPANNLRDLTLRLDCVEHGQQCRPEIELSSHCKVVKLQLWHVTIENLYAVARHLEQVDLHSVTIPVLGLRRFIQSINPTSNMSITACLLNVTLEGEGANSVDLEVEIKGNESLVISQCEHKDCDDTWWVMFHTLVWACPLVETKSEEAK